jgi:hypothetical protein
MHVPLVRSGQKHPLSIHLYTKKYWDSNYREILYTNYWKIKIGSLGHINWKSWPHKKQLLHNNEQQLFYSMPHKNNLEKKD